MIVPRYLGSVRLGEEQLAEAYKVVSERHSQEYEIREMCLKFAEWSEGHVEGMQPLIDRYGIDLDEDAARLRSGLFHGLRAGGADLLKDLQDLSVLASSTRTQWTILVQASGPLKDKQMETTGKEFGAQLDRQIAWLCTHIKSAAPQALIVPPNMIS